MHSFSSSLKISKIRMETNQVNPASRSTFLSCTEDCAKDGDFPSTWFLKWCPISPHSARGSPWKGSLHSSTEVSWSKGNLAHDSLQSSSVWHWVRTEFSNDACWDIAASLTTEAWNIKPLISSIAWAELKLHSGHFPSFVFQAFSCTRKLTVAGAIVLVTVWSLFYSL